MIASAAPPISPAELEQVLRRVEPAALLVPPRILRRVIKHDRGFTGLGLQVPHRKSYVIGREALLRIAGRDELGVPADRELPPTLLLFNCPEPGRLAKLPRGQALLRCWRLLFHARVHQRIAGRVADGKLTEAGVRERVARIGRTEFEEARSVLRQENLLLPPDELLTAYEEFAALFLELRHFDPSRLASYFPTVVSFDAVASVLAEDIDADELFAVTRPEGAADPDPGPPPDFPLSEPPPAEVADLMAPPPAVGGYRRLMARAGRAAARGNVVRAAMLRVRAAQGTEPDRARTAHAVAWREVGQMMSRLRNALRFPDDEAPAWREALLALLEPAARSYWSSEARLLYDLQKVCVDRERAVYAVDLVEWFVTCGRRPVKRLLPNQQQVLMVKHLRSALHRLTAVRIPEPIRRRLVTLLIDAVHRAEGRLREQMRPPVRQSLDEVGLVPANVAERVARDKAVEELLDLVVERTFLTMSDLRDAIARNRLKLPDLGGRPADGQPPGGLWRRSVRWLQSLGAGVREFFLGDQLIRANRRLAANVDGVYRRGEVYLRWLQRLSSLAFGTAVGRFLTLYLVLPFVSGFAVVMMWQEVSGLVRGKHGGHHLHVPWPVVGALSVFCFALFHVGPFRRALGDGLKRAWRGARALFYELPAALLRLPAVRRLLQSDAFQFCCQFVFKPLVAAAPVTAGLLVAHAPAAVALGAGAAVLVAAGLLLNSRLGMRVEEVFADSLVRTWLLVRSDIVPGLVRWVMFLFKRLQEDVERVLYTVDEWLRFRTGDSRLSLVAKAVLGLAWFVCTYLIRVFINLFVEPTFNPIKHFPVVTVAAKLILPFYKVLFAAITGALAGAVGGAVAGTAATTAIFLIPGLAGFIAWELKENWRLYRANQPATLRPEVVGHHGETVLRLMRPGLHSGTLPKLYAKLRRGRGRSVRKQYEALHHLRGRLAQFVERDLLAVLAGSKSWGGPRLSVGEIRLAANRIRVELCCLPGGGSLRIDLEEHSGWLVAKVGGTGGECWVDHLTGGQAAVLKDALAGFYKLAGVDLVQEQVEAALPPGTPFDLTPEGLVVWPVAGFESGAVYDLGAGPESRPRPLVATAAVDERALELSGLLFHARPIYWGEWVEVWQRDHDGKGHTPLEGPEVRLLPCARECVPSG